MRPPLIHPNPPPFTCQNARKHDFHSKEYCTSENVRSGRYTKAFNRTEYIVFIAALLITLFAASCEKDEISGSLVFDPQLASELKSKSMDTLSLESGDYILEAELYRDFLPGGPVPRRSPLVAIIYLVNTDSLPVSENLSVSRLYVINSGYVWIASLGDRSDTYVPDFKLEKVNSDGPEWETGIYVDVILEIKNRFTAQVCYLMARNQYIQKVE